MTWKSKVITTKDMMNLGVVRVIADYTGVSPVWEDISTTWETTTTSWDLGTPVTFKLWIDKELVFTTTVTDKSAFKLPTGYRTDTFEVGVEGAIRIRAVHIAETALGLKEV
jgi:hypothetical protein